MDDPKQFLSRQQASDYLRDEHGVTRSVAALALLAFRGSGPVFRKMGRLSYYLSEDLDAWVQSMIGPPMRSTDGTSKLKGRKRKTEGAMRAQEA